MRHLFLGFLALFITASPVLATPEMAGQTGTTPPPAADAKKPPIKGVVQETMISGGYTYIYLKTDKDTKWYAIPKVALAVGETIEIQPGIDMGEHYSKTLKRTFTNIVFSDGLTTPRPKEDKESSTRKQAAHASVGLDTTKEGGGDLLANNLKIAKAPGPDSYTVAEAITQSKTLADKRVKVRGKIVKASKGIMGTNWYHIRDGSGDATAKTNNLVVTGRTEMLLGDTVTAFGTIHIDKDFGGGYYYEVIMEEAEFSP